MDMTFHFGSVSGFMRAKMGCVSDSGSGHLLQTQLGQRIHANCDMKRGIRALLQGGHDLLCLLQASKIMQSLIKSAVGRHLITYQDLVDTLPHRADGFPVARLTLSLYVEGRRASHYCALLKRKPLHHQDQLPIGWGVVDFLTQEVWSQALSGGSNPPWSALLCLNGPKQICWHLLTVHDDFLAPRPHTWESSAKENAPKLDVLMYA